MLLYDQILYNNGSSCMLLFHQILYKDSEQSSSKEGGKEPDPMLEEGN